MCLSENVSLRLKRVFIGIAMGMAIWLLYASYLILSSAIRIHAPMGGYEIVLTPIAPSQK